MDQELQFLISTLYGDKLNEKQLSNIIQMWDNNQNGYLDLLRKKAASKMPAGTNKVNPVMALKIRNQAVGITPKIGLSSYTFDKNAGKAANDMSDITNFNDAFRKARQDGHKTFFWKKTKANPSGLFSTEVASKQSETEKPALKPKEKNYGESTPASKAQPLTKTEYAFDGSHIDIGKFPDVALIDENDPHGGYLPEFGPNAKLYTNPSSDSYLPWLYPYDKIITIGNIDTYKDGTPRLDFSIPINAEVPEITGSNGTEFGKLYVSNMRKELEKRDEYFRRKGMYKKGGTMNKVHYFSQGGTAQNGQADAFMQSVLQGDSKAIGQLIQAANQGDENATKLIKTILQEDLKGNQQVAKAASVIKLLLNQTTSAKWGSKLQYIRSLKFAKGGKTCPACMQYGGNTVKVAKKDVDTKTYQKQSVAKKAELDEHRLGTETSANKNGSYNTSHKPSAQDSTTIHRSTMSADMNKVYPRVKSKACGGTAPKAKKHYFGGWL